VLAAIGCCLTYPAYRLTLCAMEYASQVTRGRRATVTLQLIEGIPTANAAAGVAHSARLEPLQAGVAVVASEFNNRNASQNGAFSTVGGARRTAGGHLVGAPSSRVLPVSRAFGVPGEVTTPAASLADAFELPLAISSHAILGELHRRYVQI
jgi:hypothetical protein